MDAHDGNLSLDLESSGFTKSRFTTHIEQFKQYKPSIGEFDYDEIYSIEKIEPYQFSISLAILYYLLCILSLGILPLLTRWYPYSYIWFTHKKSSNFATATTLLVTAKETRNKTICKIERISLSNSSELILLLFTYRHANYILDVEKNSFQRIVYSFEGISLHEIHSKLFKPDDFQSIWKQLLFGKNSIQIPLQHIFFLFVDEILQPFYLFQIFSVLFWITDTYFVYAAVIALLATSSLIISVFTTRKNQEKLHNMAKINCQVKRIVNLKVETIDSEELVPGDVILIENQSSIPCDCIVLQGQCIVNEAMLTGESIPIIKTALPNETNQQFFFAAHKHSHILFSGTQVLQVKHTPCYGFVYRIGFQTSKGHLLLSILFPKLPVFHFYRDSILFVLVMFGLGLLGYIISLVQLTRLGVSAFLIIKKLFEIITIVVPPALPISITVGITFSMYRLRKYYSVFCTSPSKVILAGKLKVMCFDKTGTLTHSGLDLFQIIGIEYNQENQVQFMNPIYANQISNLYNHREDILLQKLLHILCSCHSIEKVEERLIGDPLDLKLFESTKWNFSLNQKLNCTITPPNYSSNFSTLVKGLEIVKRFEFTPELQRMSVIVQEEYNESPSELYYFVKGSPEIIASLSLSETIPVNFSDVLQEYAQLGFRVIACAYKKISLDVQVDQQLFFEHAKREDLETDLIFAGIVVLQNMLKEDTTQVIDKLNNASVRNIMITGDHPLTATSVAKQCHIVQHSTSIFKSEAVKQHGKIVKIEWRNIVNSDQLLEEAYWTSKIFVENQLVVTGEVFDYLFDQLETVPEFIALQRRMILKHCNVFARMAPHHKMRVVEEFQKLNYFVGFCGDGSNDIGALKQAHVGISLSEAEASIAAPFTCLTPSIACVPALMTEGRSALETFFTLFKFMALYSFFQALGVIILSFINSSFGSFQFLFVDLFVVFPVVIVLSRTEPAKSLGKYMPTTSLFSMEVLGSIFLHWLLTIAFQLLCWFDVRSQPWYELDPINPYFKNVFSYENTVLFYITSTATINVSFAIAWGNPFKRSICLNPFFVLLFVILNGFIVYSILWPDWILSYLLELRELPFVYRVRILSYCCLYVTMAIFMERVLIIISEMKRLIWIKLFDKQHQSTKLVVKKKSEYQNTLEAPLLDH